MYHTILHFLVYLTGMSNERPAAYSWIIYAMLPTLFLDDRLPWAGSNNFVVDDDNSDCCDFRREDRALVARISFFSFRLFKVNK